MRSAIWVALGVFAGPAFASATGHVVGPDGAAIQGAQVCEFVEGAPEHCITVDANGVYKIDKPKRSSLLVRATGYTPQIVDAAQLSAPITLQHAAVLEIRVVDMATKQPVPSGKIMLDSPSGRRIGQFVPFNKQGVRISTLDPGDLFVRAEADGYDPSGPVAVTLSSGTKTAITVPLIRSAGSRH